MQIPTARLFQAHCLISRHISISRSPEVNFNASEYLPPHTIRLSKQLPSLTIRLFSSLLATTEPQAATQTEARASQLQ